jgi:hypothetical protein
MSGQDLFWQNKQPWLATNFGGPNGAGGGFGTPADTGAITQGRDVLDNIRMHPNSSRNGAAEYPDGYLGTITGQRQDRLNSGVVGRLSDRSYQRGIHKGTKMDPQQYFWPEEYSSDRGINRPVFVNPITFCLEQKRQVPVPISQEYLMHPSMQVMPSQSDPVTQPYMDHLNSMLPDWT